jgi:predicted lipoprotein with Yx(FWY)xxD motif
MKRLLIAAVIVAAALALAACGGGGGDNGNASPVSGNGTATVSVEEIGGAGSVLVDSAGQALYAADEEADSDVLCTDGCTAFWMPLTIDAGAPTGDAVSGELGIAERPDGTRQVTLDGKRLYTFVEDEPGEVTGDGFSDAFGGQQFTWHVVAANGSTPEGGTGEDTFRY